VYQRIEHPYFDGKRIVDADQRLHCIPLNTFTILPQKARTMFPTTAVGAASHPDPYPYYQQLLAGAPLVFEPQSGLWLASRAAVIEEVLANAACTVRPSGEQLPAALAGSSAGGVFAHLVRMNEGAAHAGPKRALQQALSSVNLVSAAATTRELGALLAAVHGLPEREQLTPWAFDLPTWVVADLLGFERADLPQLARWMSEFVACLSPLSNADQLASASAAARALVRSFEQLLHGCAARPDSLLSRVRHEAALAGWTERAALLANLIGLLSQTHEATAGLLSNSVLALLTRPDLQEQLRRDPGLCCALVQEVARFDPPVQNTRRFVAQATSVGGVALQPGATILLLLGAAGRDPARHDAPDQFRLDRPQRALLGFGHGRHACPGQALATTITSAALDIVLGMPRLLDPARHEWTWRASANARLPQFSRPTDPKESP
jgi:cytochrome P450